MKPGSRTLVQTTLLVCGVLFGLFRLLGRLFDSSFFLGLSNLAFASFFLVAAIWLFRVLWRRFFWRVGRRLAFSYFVVGVLPLAMVVLLFLITAYLFGGFLLGHLYRDATSELGEQLEAAAQTRLADLTQRRRELTPAAGPLAFAEYRNGRKVSGLPEAPAAWPAWLDGAATANAAPPSPPPAPAGAKAGETSPDRNESAAEGAVEPPGPPLLVGLRDGRISAAAVATNGDQGVLVYWDGDLAAELRRRTRVWLELLRDDDPRRKSTTRISILGFDLRFGGGLWLGRTEEQNAEYRRLNPPGAGGVSFFEKPLLMWVESTGPLPALDGGETVVPDIAASLAGSPKRIFDALLSTSADVDSAAWLALAGITVLFAEIYLVAAGIAIFMIFGLSRAVNRLSRATDAIGHGDFSTRIPVRRKDQLGDLQRSFNSMSEHLEELVQTEAQKEALDKELELARKVQRDLLPAAIAERPGVEFATYFEPSAAIGGDYFDILDARGDRIAVMIADVAGHGLAAGLRMAMVKAAVTLQIEDAVRSAEIFARLHRLLSRLSGERSFVTASLSVFDRRDGRLVVTNAGHPPAYRIRAGGEVDELLVPGVPLGMLAGAPGRLETTLAPGEAVVWLSDGLIEATDAADRQFGFAGVERALAGAPGSAAEVRDRLLAAVRSHSAGRPPEDDRTLVVMRYLGPTDGSRFEPAGASASE